MEQVLSGSGTAVVSACVLFGVLLTLATYSMNRSRCTIEQAVQQSGYTESVLRELITARFLAYRRKYVVCGPYSLDAGCIPEAATTFQEVQRIRQASDASLRQQARDIAARIQEANRVAQAQLNVKREELECLKRLHAELLQNVRQKAIPLRVIQALQVLGLESDATFDAIHHQFRVLAKRYHPDTGGDHHQFLRIHDAYTCVITWLESQQET